MQQGKMFFMMGLCMAIVQGGYVRRIPHGNEITAAINVSIINNYLIDSSFVIRLKRDDILTSVFSSSQQTDRSEM